MAVDARLARGAARKVAILDAAVQVVARHGAGGLTHRAAAAEAGTSLASVTYHFPSIEQLRRAMFDHAGSRIGKAFRKMLEAADTEVDDVPQRSADFVVWLVSERREDMVAVCEMIIAAGHDPELRPVMRFFTRLAELLVPYVGDRVHALTAATAVQGLVLATLADGEPADTDRLRNAVADLIGRFKGSP